MIRNILTIMRGTVLAQAIGFLALPVLSRLFAPESFGHYQLFISLLTLALVLPTLRYEVALLRVDDGDDYRGLLRICLILCVAVSLLVAALVGILELVDWPDQLDDIPFSPWLLVVAMMIGGVSQVFNLVATREKSYPVIANSKIVQSLVYVGFALGTGAVLADPLGLVYADIIGRVALLVFLGAWMLKAVPDMRGKIAWPAVRTLIHRYREYPFISTPGTLINVTGGILTPIMIYATFSAASSGQYGLLERSVAMPLSLIVIAVGQVYTSEFSHQLRSDKAEALKAFRKLLKVMALVALVPMIVLLVGGPTLFALFFGEEWQLAGQLARIMAPAFATTLLSGPIHMVLTVLGYQKLQTAWEVSRLALVLGLWSMVPVLSMSLTFAVGIYSGIIVACNLGFVLLAFLTLRHALATESQTPAAGAQ